MAREYPMALRSLLAAAGLLTLLACGGGGGGTGSGTTGSPQPKAFSDTLTYADPASGTYRLVKNTTKSTRGHLVLDLVGPSGDVSGVGFLLTADQSKVSWGTVDAGDSERVNSSVFSSTLTKSKVVGGRLEAGVYQKGATPAVHATSATVLASVALDLRSGVAISVPPTVTLSTGKALLLNPPSATPPTTAISISVGVLSAN